MQKILILGTGVLAEELFDLIDEIPGYDVVGFVENLDESKTPGNPRRATYSLD